MGKRQRINIIEMSASDSSDEEYGGILKKALDVNLPDDFNPNSIPQNGEEYLQHVIYERRKCKKLVRANIDYNKFKNKQTIHVTVVNTKSVVPDYCRPSIEWQKDRIDDFTDFRKYVHSKITSESTVQNFNEVVFLKRVKSVKPRFSEITQYTQASKITMLQLITKHLSELKPGESIEDNMGTWIYAILTLLEIPLTPSHCHSLREFTKRCAELRSNLPDNADESLYIPLNLYICLIARYFQQLDLAD